MLENHHKGTDNLDVLLHDYVSEETGETEDSRRRDVLAKQTKLAERNKVIREAHEQQLKTEKEKAYADDSLKSQIFYDVLKLQNQPNFAQKLEDLHQQLSAERTKLWATGDADAIHNIQTRLNTLEAIAPSTKDTKTLHGESTKFKQKNMPEQLAHRPRIDFGVHAKEVHTPEIRPRTPEEKRVLDTQARLASQEADITSRAKAEVLQNLLASGISKNEYRAKLDEDIAYFEAESSGFDDESPEMTNLKKLKAQRKALNNLAYEEATTAKTKREAVSISEQPKTALETLAKETKERKDAIRKEILNNEREISIITKERDALKWWNWLQRGDRNAEIKDLEDKNLELKGKLSLAALSSEKRTVKPEYRTPKVEVSARPEIAATELEPLEK